MNFSKPIFALLVIFPILIGSVNLNAASNGELPEVNRNIEQLLQTEGLEIKGASILTRTTLLEAYQAHDFAPYWTSSDKIRELMELIQGSADHGLLPSDYNVDQLVQVLQQKKSSPSAETDILLSESLFRYGYHRRLGKVEASKLDPDVNYKRESFHKQPVGLTFNQVLESSSLTDFVDKLAPTGPVYRNLQKTLVQYREIAAAGGWSAVTEGPTLRLEDEGPRVGEIRRLLVITGDLPASADNNSALFDRELKGAVEAFQQRHALGNDGIVGKQTIATMNIPVSTRIDQLRTSLERLRWVNQAAHETLIAVNIAGYRAFFVKEGKLEWHTRVMVGKNYRKTPVFTGEIAYLEFNPTWTIPPGILRNDTLPAIKRDPNYLASKEIEVIDRGGKIINPSTVDWTQYSKSAPYTFRQKPGPHNSLGTVKFIFPNEHFVFLHDTPHRELFVQPERAFSSGCVRVQNPLELAELVLDDAEKYSRLKLEAIVDSRKTQRINVRPKMPVYILYLTASFDPSGKPRFFKDVYKRDPKVLAALNGPVTIHIPDNG